ncbi:sulfotransferase [Actinocatenispora rupis]|uniref:Sulfotransferase family protein n=2 Tax=Actinocatenispora rupis TaxID=519421 RepID=A0A8J3J3W0_9ACTN|nr:sulfotransferase family protein [Actinocatenispora rupis]
MKRTINQALARTLGYQLVRVRGTGNGHRVTRTDRLLHSPVFILSSVRSGSTLLRAVLGSHSTLYSPHELHLPDVTATVSGWYAEQAMAELGFDRTELTALLRDRLLDAALHRSGKTTLVEKTPNHVFAYRSLADTWRDARFIFLLRHPAAIHRSWREARPTMTADDAATDVLRYLTALQEARTELTGIDVRYEDLTAEPERETRRLCAWLGVDWEPAMLEYGQRGQTRFRRGLGDWSGKINSGAVQAARPTPGDVPEALRDICRAWGYPVPD